MKLSHLNALRALEATLRLGTFTAAAEELGVTVAAIGQQVRGLEDYLGLKLFERLPSGARPTPKARVVAERLTSGFSEIEDAMAELRMSRDGRQLSLSLTYHYLDNWLSQRLPGFFSRHPDIELRIDASDRLVDLLSENIDMAIRFSREVGAEHAALDICHGYCMPVCSPDFAAAYNLTEKSRDLTGVPLFLLFDATTDPEWSDWPAWMQRYDLTTRDSVVPWRYTGQITAISGGGLVLTGLTEAFNDLRNGRLVAPLGPRVVRRLSYSYRLVWSATRHPHRAANEFRDWIREERDLYLADASALIGIKLD